MSAENTVTQFKRLDAKPLDADSTVANRAALESYLSLPSVAYPGHVVWVESDNTAVLIKDPEQSAAEELQSVSVFEGETTDDTSTLLSPVNALVGLSTNDLWHTKAKVICRSANEKVAAWKAETVWKANGDSTPTLRRVGFPTVTQMAADDAVNDTTVKSSLFASVLPTVEVTGLPSTTIGWRAEIEVFALPSA